MKITEQNGKYILEPETNVDDGEIRAFVDLHRRVVTATASSPQASRSPLSPRDQHMVS